MGNQVNAILEGLFQSRVEDIVEISKLDLINLNKKRYEFVQKNSSKFIKDKIDKEITDSLILRWIKGKNWEGGLGNGRDVDKMIESICDKLNLDPDDLLDRFDNLVDKWEDIFKKEGL